MVFFKKGKDATIFLKDMETLEYRPCMVKGKEAVFHKWVSRAEIRQAVLIGETGGQLMQPFAIVEFEDGTIQEVDPCLVRFLDDMVRRTWKAQYIVKVSDIE